MAVDKLVDSTQLNSDLTSVANAIRTKGGTSAQLAFPSGFVSAIGDISSDPELYYTSNYVPYAKNMHIPYIKVGVSFGMFNGASEMLTMICDDDRTLGGSNAQRINDYFRNCPKLTSASFPYLQGFLSGYTNYFLSGCPALKTAVFGSVGHPITNFLPTATSDKIFNGLTQNDLVITIYVNANTLGDVPAEVKTYAPWGATNATIVYKSSTTGEVLI